ncbi:hypothetical protein NKG05_25220 [Oerskovia sp. M15]
MVPLREPAGHKGVERLVLRESLQEGDQLLPTAHHSQRHVVRDLLGEGLERQLLLFGCCRVPEPEVLEYDRGVRAGDGGGFSHGGSRFSLAVQEASEGATSSTL